VLEPTKDKVLAKQKSLPGSKVKRPDRVLCRVSRVPFYNTSRYTFEKLKGWSHNGSTRREIPAVNPSLPSLGVLVGLSERVLFPGRWLVG